MSQDLSPIAAAIKARRQELAEKPLSRIYEELAEAARVAHLKELDARWKRMFEKGDAHERSS